MTIHQHASGWRLQAFHWSLAAISELFVRRQKPEGVLIPSEYYTVGTVGLLHVDLTTVTLQVHIIQMTVPSPDQQVQTNKSRPTSPDQQVQTNKSRPTSPDQRVQTNESRPTSPDQQVQTNKSIGWCQVQTNKSRPTSPDQQV
ncbi:hypothetical protein EYF80_012123 [Liparis tanakae]|uniref:Uncharacterized protein n=1 Tax=Liparis tanakae TaxID=230148 RepID=A0A4Z2IK44_9TELE|nr:hypothetical protein EYF80_012123 [Liparis tanakae]